ncbi:DNA topoisomerase IV subunit A [Ureaplasma diversum]
MIMEKQRVIKTPLDLVVSESYGKYAKYIIQDRALPDVRDGLKPVQRRILYAMNDLNIHYDKPYKKSARSVGEVIGKYHPHGDSSIYEAMVRMSQDWKNNLCLLDMHGNKGSIDGDAAAAMRYTEARLSKVANLMLQNLDKNTVKFMPNFDDSEKEPSVLPSIFPNLLINGATGIASGYTTNIPPHNPNEVCDALVYKISHPNCSIDDLIKICPAPDFPTGGEIHGLDGCYNAAKTGTGKFAIRASITTKTDLAKIDQLIITSIPYDTNKSQIVKQIDEIIYNKEVAGLLEVRDESDAKGVCVVIDIRKDSNLENIKNYLYKKTLLQINYSTRFIAIVDRAPVLLTLDQYLDAQIKHSLDIINKTDIYDLNKINLRKEVVLGLIKAIDIIDQIIALIRSSSSKQEAKEKLVATFDFTINQAEAIVMMRLYRLTKTDINDLKAEYEQLVADALIIQARIDDINIRKQYLKELIKNIKKEFGYARKTLLVDQLSKIEINEDDMIEKQDLMITISSQGYIKTVRKKSFESSKYNEAGIKTNDLLVYINHINSHHKINIVTSLGKLISIVAHKLPILKWKDIGEHLNNFVKCEGNESVIYAFISDENFDFNSHQLLLTTKHNIIKKINLAECELNKPIKSISVMKLADHDQLISAQLLKANLNYLVFISTSNGLGMIFSSHEVSLLSRTAKGIKACKLKLNDYLISAYALEHSNHNLALFLDGALKIVNLNDLKLSHRFLTPSNLFLSNKKIKPVLASFLLTKGNGFYLLKNDGSVNVFALVDPKAASFDTKPINNNELNDLKQVSYDYFISELADSKAINKATIVASQIEIVNLEEETESTIDLLSTIGDKEYES